MALFVKVKRSGGDARLYEMRGLATTVGETSRGVLTFDSPVFSFFSIYAAADRYFLSVSAEGFRSNGYALAPKEEIAVDDALAIEGRDCSFSFFVSSSAAEVLAHSRMDAAALGAVVTAESCSARLNYRLSRLSRSFPLFRNVELSIGSSAESDSIFIDPDFTAAQHAYLTYTGDAVVVRRGRGAVALYGEQPRDTLVLSQNSMLTFPPLGLTVEVSLPRPR